MDAGVWDTVCGQLGVGRLGPARAIMFGVARILPEAMMLSRLGLLPRAMSGSMALR